MDLRAYLDRIGYHGSPDRTAENLAVLLRCHLESVPFENLDFYNSPREMPLSTEALYDKIVLRRRGGVCCELNTLFGRLLESMGYDCYPVLVRVVMPGAPAQISHQGIVATVEGKRYYCDVGFGGPGPKGLVELDTQEHQQIYGETFRVTQDPRGVTIWGAFPGGEVPILEMIDVPARYEDFTVVLYYSTGYPNSYFLGRPIVNLCLPNGSKALTGNQLTIRRDGEMTRRILETDAEMAEVLWEEFGL